MVEFHLNSPDMKLEMVSIFRDRRVQLYVASAHAGLSRRPGEDGRREGDLLTRGRQRRKWRRRHECED
eukprot:13931218-Heterocapsa_arctica.AAC.1